MLIRASKFKLLTPTRPNLGLEHDYRCRLEDWLEVLHCSIRHWLLAQYRRTPPELAQDIELPASDIKDELSRLGDRWLKKFDDLAPDLARYFATRVEERSRVMLQTSLKKAGFTVPFSMSRATQDVFQATLQEQVNLIKSIPQQYLTQVASIVNQGVQVGRDAHVIAKQLEEQYGVTKRRAALIARDQNNKATATITRVRQLEAGIRTARWLHSGGGAHPRPEHVAYSGKEYDIEKGAWVDGEWIWPGIKINCRCTSQAIVVGFS